MTQYNISLKVDDKELSILYNALAYYSSMGENTTEYTTEDVGDLLDKVGNLYLEEDTSSLTPAEVAFIEEFGVDCISDSSGRWEGFLAAWKMNNPEE